MSVGGESWVVMSMADGTWFQDPPGWGPFASAFVFPSHAAAQNRISGMGYDPTVFAIYPQNYATSQGAT